MASTLPARKGRPPKPKEVEEWKDIIGYEGLYQISSFGRVKSLTKTLPHKLHGHWTIKERILKQYLAGPKGSQYLAVWLHSGMGQQRTFKIHRLVATHFLGINSDKPFVNHKDCNKTNNKLSNLEWTTPLENTRHAILNGQTSHSKDNVMKKVLNIDTGEVFNSIADAEIKTIHKKTGAVSHCLRGKTNSAYGFHWRYI